jgi:ABC-type glutathione transport system ATPase component
MGSRIEIRELRAPIGAVKAARNVSFNFDAGEVLGLIGESGSGKCDRAPRRLGKRFECERCE